MEKIALDGEDGASEVSAAGNSGSASDIEKPEQVIPPDEEASHSRKSILHFEPVRVVSSADSGYGSHKRRQKPKWPTPLGRHGLTFSSPPHVPRARPPRKTDFTHTPDQLWHIAAENQRTVKCLMDISHRRSEWIGVQESKVFVPKLSGTARRRREAQQRLEQSNSWLQKRLQAIDAAAGRAYSLDRAHSSGARQKSYADTSLPPASHPQQAALTRDVSDFWGSSIAAVHGSGSFQGNECAVADRGLQLKKDSPVPGLDLAGITVQKADAHDDEHVSNS